MIFIQIEVWTHFKYIKMFCVVFNFDPYAFK